MKIEEIILDSDALKAISKIIFMLVSAVLYYLGIPLLLKAIFRNHFCFTAYGIAQIIILLDFIYRIGSTEFYTPPSIFNKLPGAILWLILTVIITKIILKIMKVPHSWFAIMFGSSFGSLGVFLIGSLYIEGMQPFYPISQKNPLFGIIEASCVSNFLLFSLLLSLGIFTFRWIRSFFFSKISKISV